MDMTGNAITDNLVDGLGEQQADGGNAQRLSQAGSGIAGRGVIRADSRIEI